MTVTINVMNKAADPYDAVIADLQAKRDQIDKTIALLTSLRTGGAPLVDECSPDSGIVETAGMFLGMSIADGAKKLLSMRKKTLGNVEIARELQAGGMAMNSKDPVNTVGAVLTRRFNDVGDIVKMGRGIWGLKEWYPGRNFKPTDKRLPREAIEANLNVLGRVDAAETATRIVADRENADRAGLDDIL